MFYDLHGHKFKLISLGLLRRVESTTILESTEIILKPIDKSDIIGNILVKEYPCINFLFSSHPLMFKMVDDDYESEFNIAQKKFKCGLFSLERFLEDKKFIYGDQITGLTIYRGWMLSVDVYQRLYIELEKIGIYLINTPEEYERYRHLPKWYNDFKDFTPFSVWNNSNNLDDALKLTENLSGSYIVKDYVKSRKHERYDACFIKDIKNKQKTREILSNFIDRQDDMLVGGVVLKKLYKARNKQTLYKVALTLYN
ncbi:MAG: ATP-grasp domain-containing protein [Erysipelotrichaceae bacterium]